MIVEAVTLVFGLFFLVVGFIWSFQLLSLFPSVFICIIGFVGLYKELRWNAYALCINDYNGKKVFKLNNAKKFYKKSKNKAGYYLKIDGFSKVYPYPEQKYVNLNLTNRRPFFCVFYQESDQLAPVKTEYSKEQIEALIKTGEIKNLVKDEKKEGDYKPMSTGFDVDNVNFISSDLIANHYQMKSVVKEMVKPPVDSLRALVNVGLLICMIGCIITNVYIAGKLGLNVGIINEAVVKIDQFIGGFEDMLNRLEGGINNLAGVTGETLEGVPPVTG